MSGISRLSLIIIAVMAIMALSVPASVRAGYSLVNGSFEDGTLNGWTVIGNIADYDPVPLTVCPCGHGLTAPDGQCFAGRVRKAGIPPSPTGNPALFRQAVEVRNWDVNADRTDFDFEIWVQIGFTGPWSDWAATQTYSIRWNNDGLMPPNLAGSLDRQYKIAYISNMAFSKGTTNSFDNWRKIKLSGSIPANPQFVVLEIRLTTAATTIHNAVDGVVFSALSATGSSVGPFAGDIENGDFEMGPYNLVHYGRWDPHPPTGWAAGNRIYMNAFGFVAGYPSTYDGGPVEGYTNSVTTPTDPRGISTTSGDHFWGRAKPPANSPANLLGTWDCKGWWGKVMTVHNWNPCAIGVRWKIHYLTKMWDSNDSGFQTIEFCWDAPGAPNSILSAPADPYQAQMLSDQWFPWIRVVDLNDRSTPRSSEFSGFDEIEQTGEFAATDINGFAYCPEKILLRHFTYVYAGSDHSQLFKWLYDKVDVYVEAIPGPHPAIHTPSLLPPGSCHQTYTSRLEGCGLGTTTFALVAGKLPYGLAIDSTGLISGRPVTAGTAEFTVQITDDYDGSEATKQFQIMVSGSNCCNAPPADLDSDDDVDQVDFAFLQACVTGAGGGIPEGCICADLNLDAAGVDLADLELFERCASGPGVAALPTCQY